MIDETEKRFQSYELSGDFKLALQLAVELDLIGVVEAFVLGTRVDSEAEALDYLVRIAYAGPYCDRRNSFAEMCRVNDAYRAKRRAHE